MARSKNQDSSASNTGNPEQLRDRATALGVPIKDVDDSFLPVMTKMAEGRPHNGCILEASPIPQLPAECLLPVTDQLSIRVGRQSAEERAVNGAEGAIKKITSDWRKPFVLFLDGITDVGNYGGILRTAYFLGVDAVAVTVRATAPLNSIAVKASAGAAEAIPILKVNSPQDFISQSKTNGWKVYAAVAPGKEKAKRASGAPMRKLSTTTLTSPLADSPVILMLGSEGEGLHPFLEMMADCGLYIPRVLPSPSPGQRPTDIGVDSLNVSVAAGILCEKFMTNPNEKKEAETKRLF